MAYKGKYILLISYLFQNFFGNQPEYCFVLDFPERDTFQ